MTMVVQQHVLNWLYSVLTSEYHDVNRTYNDVAQGLSQYPSLSPRTDVHTFPNGSSALLVHLSGTIPVLFRGATYRFPVSIWVPHAYPREPPLVYVTPTDTMMVRPGQHVDPQGQVYHPYLVGWSTFWDKSTILDFLAILQDIFAKEPPVVARQQAPPPPPAQQTQTPPPVPPLPPDLASQPAARAPSSSAEDARPPPPPPKPGPQPAPTQQRSPAPIQGAQHSGTPVPPPPPKLGGPSGRGEPDRMTPPHPNPSNAGPSRYETAPPLPPQAAVGPIPGSGQVVPPPAHHHPHPQPPQYQQPPPGAAYLPGPQDPRHSTFQPIDPRVSTPAHHRPFDTTTPPPPTWQHQHPPPPVQAQTQVQLQPQPQPKPPPPPDLMDDDLTLTIPSPSTAPPPPIPPNPEKDHLLHQLAQTLHAHRQKAHSQNTASLQGLHAQRTAMLQAMTNLQAESAQLTQLTALLTSNHSILQDSLRQADSVIENSAGHPAPDIDELLVAPTVVGNQLYELVAEERALADAVFVLGRAVERGRIAPQTFARMTRGLAREWYLKKALVRKIGRGMGLVEEGWRG